LCHTIHDSGRKHQGAGKDCERRIMLCFNFMKKLSITLCPHISKRWIKYS
jgi:hypothetical protein